MENNDYPKDQEQEASEEIFDDQNDPPISDESDDTEEVVFDDLPDDVEENISFTEDDSRQQYIEELESSLEQISDLAANNLYQTVQILGDIISLNEKRYYEGSHSRFVAHKSGEVAREIGMSETDVFEIKSAGLLHDIGKIGFDSRLQAKFTAEMNTTELDIYKLHSNLGYQVLKNHQSFSNIARIVHQHHERLDGTGFPNKLKGKEITPGAAIVAVVEVFHNLVFKRPKKNLEKNFSSMQYFKSREKRLTNAIEYLNVKATKTFDTKVVEVFCENIREEWGEMIQKTVWRMTINQIEDDMMIAEDYFNRSGLLIAARGERMNPTMKKLMIRLAEAGEMPKKILIMK